MDTQKRARAIVFYLFWCWGLQRRPVLTGLAARFTSVKRMLMGARTYDRISVNQGGLFRAIQIG